MNKFFIILVLFVLSNAKAYCQMPEDGANVVDSNQNVLILQDARLDILDKRPQALLRLALDEANSKKEIIKTETPVYNPIMAGKKTVTGSIIQKQGYRVQIYNGPDRNLAMKIKSEFNRAYPNYRSYMNYNVPNFKIKVGDFDDKKEANKFLKRMQTIIPSSFIVPDIVTVKNIIVQ